MLFFLFRNVFWSMIYLKIFEECYKNIKIVTISWTTNGPHWTRFCGWTVIFISIFSSKLWNFSKGYPRLNTWFNLEKKHHILHLNFFFFLIVKVDIMRFYVCQIYLSKGCISSFFWQIFKWNLCRSGDEFDRWSTGFPCSV